MIHPLATAPSTEAAELDTLLEAVFSGEEMQKARLAEAIRRELVQPLTALKMDAAMNLKNAGEKELVAMRRAQETLGLLNGALTFACTAAGELWPLALRDLGLAAALESLVHDFENRTGTACVVDIQQAVDLSEGLSVGVVRMVQEWLHHLADGYPKHASVHLVRVIGGIELLLEAKGDIPPMPARIRARIRVLRGRIGEPDAPTGVQRLRILLPSADR